MNITGTGIAVALAVIVALSFLFFGPEIFSFINHSPATAITTATTTIPATTNVQNMQNNEPTAGEAIGGSAAATPTTDSNLAAPSLANIPTNPTGLEMADQVVGTGTVAQAGDSVTVAYVGSLTDGTVFDASANHGGSFTFTLGAGQVIKGWDQGVAGMKVGGKRELVIPSSLGYGPQANGPIPANSTLVFEVELLGVQAPAQAAQ
jgi:peptidylprolyl isomerase